MASPLKSSSTAGTGKTTLSTGKTTPGTAAGKTSTVKPGEHARKDSEATDNGEDGEDSSSSSSSDSDSGSGSDSDNDSDSDGTKVYMSPKAALEGMEKNMQIVNNLPRLPGGA